MTDMLTKMARAIAFTASDHKHTEQQWWDSLMEDEKGCCFDKARAALMALLRADGEDVVGIERAADKVESLEWSTTIPNAINGIHWWRAFTAMIDHILKEGE